MFEFIKGALILAPHVINLGEGIYNLVEARNKRKEKQQEIEEALNNKINELKSLRANYEESNRRFQERIDDLQRQIQNQKDEAERERIEREQELIRKKKEEQEEQMRKIEKEREDIEKCKEALEMQFTESIFEIMKNFSKEEEKWINSLIGPELDYKFTNLKNKLADLFDKLFISENIMKKINEQFIKIIKTSFNEKELEKMNFIIIGNSGVGKSTFINEIFGEKKALEGSGKRTTTKCTKYESKLVPFISLLDTIGTEIGSGHKLSDVLNETLNEIMKQLNSNDPNDHVHCIIYCTTSNRFFEDELEVILKLREKYDGKKLPIVIVMTRAIKDDDVEAKKKTIDEFLQKYGEKLSDDIFGITFIKVNAREDKIKNFGMEFYFHRFGLSDLMTTCYKKGEQSYRFAIKNSLIQIGKKTIQEYLNDISFQLLNNTNYLDYLQHNFDPNFADYISFCFEKITDIDKQKGIKEGDLNKLRAYLYKEDLSTVKCMICGLIPQNPYKCKTCEGEICEKCYLNQKENNVIVQCKLCEQENFIKFGQDFNNNEKEKDNINDICMICNSFPINPLKCNFCGNKICEECYLRELDDIGSYHCKFCKKAEFIQAQKIENEKNEINDDINENNKNKNDENICMICNKKPKAPLKCEGCGKKICEVCHLSRLQDLGYYDCDYCGNEDFITFENNTNNDNNNKVEDFHDKIKKINEENEINEIKDDNNKINNNVDLFNKYCMICDNLPKNPLKCEICGYKMCEECQLNQFQEIGICQCKNCGSEEFTKIINEEQNQNEIKDNDKEIKEINNNKQIILFDDNFNQILPNNLNLESKNEINNYLKYFKSELIEVLNEKFDEFAKNSADNIHLKILEKYRDIHNEKNVSIKKMKSKEEFQSEAIEELNRTLKEKAINNFLSKVSSQFYKDIILIFKEKCEKKLDEFINNLLNNEQANEFFKNCDAFNENKKLKFDDDFKAYIEKLKKEEMESKDRALCAIQQNKENSMGESKCDTSESNCSSSKNDSNC